MEHYDKEDYIMAKKLAPAIKAVTWNLYNFTSKEKNQKVFDRLVSVERPDIIFLQEANEKNTPDFGHLGYRAVRGGQYVTLYHEERFRKTTWYMSSVGEYFTTKGERRTVRALNVTLKDKKANTDNTLFTQNYHLPAGVQKPKAPKNRIDSGIEAAKHWKKIVKSVGPSPILMAGDDNVDELGSFMDRFWYLRRAYTGLRIVRAPKPTHGKRTIDDFRVKGLRPVGKGFVWKTPSDHNLYGRKFKYRKKFL